MKDYKVKLLQGHTAREDQEKDGYLAFYGKIQHYPKVEAAKKARLFGGAIELNEEKDRFKKYVNNGGVSCPFCGTEDIKTDPPEFDTGSIWQHVECCLCGKKWLDIYKLIGVEETN